MERKTYSVTFLLSKMNEIVEPIPNLTIQNITIPASLQKKRATQSADSIETNIRALFNSVTTDNLEKLKESLFKIVVEKAQTSALLERVANEIFENFLISEANIINYLVLLNKVQRCAVSYDDPETKEKKISKTIGFFFLEKCRKQFFDFSKPVMMEKLAKLNQDDEDEFDQYNRERERMLNLIVTICVLYQNRNKKDCLSLTVSQMGPCLTDLVKNYVVVLKKYESLLDPETGDSKDEFFDQNEINRKMLILYAEEIYTVLARTGQEFFKEDRVASDIVLIKKYVEPSLMSDYLIANFKKLSL